MKISKDDLFTYYLQKNFWPKGIGFDEFLEIMKQQGVEVTYGTGEESSKSDSQLS